MAAEILELANESPAAVGKLTKGIMSAIDRSFREDKSRATQDEIRRRGHICVGIARALRHELKWSVDRIVDELPKALRSKLDGIPWDPSKLRAMWTPPTDIIVP